MQPIERQAISAIRVLAADAIQKANSGADGLRTLEADEA